jgi:uncharacterized protein (TIGR00730 family)
MKSVCIFCGSSVGRQPEYIHGARRIGKLIATKKMTLVYGGGNIGLMREVADSALSAGGKVIGVMPRSIVEKEIAHQNITKLHIVGSMHERKALMAEISDGFIALPGGFGTIDELFEIMTWNQLEIISKPTGLLNINGFFDQLINYISHAVSEKFVRKEHQENLIVDVDETRLMSRMADFRPVAAEKWIDRLKMDLI